MLRLYAHLYTVAIRDLANVTSSLSFALYEGRGDESIANFKDQINKALAGVNHPLVSAGLPLSPLLRVRIRRLIERMQTADARPTIAQAEVLLKELHNDLVIDLSASLFLAVPYERKEFYEQSQPPFGEQVADAFPDANADIAAASRCIALDEWTAAVFHLMRVLEHGLRWVANDIGVAMSPELDEQWKTLIDRILSEIGKLEGKPKTPEKAEHLKFYSTVGLDLRNFKNAWRNAVSHSRATYDEREAMAVWQHVRAFMQELAARIAP